MLVKWLEIIHLDELNGSYFLELGNEVTRKNVGAESAKETKVCGPFS